MTASSQKYFTHVTLTTIPSWYLFSLLYCSSEGALCSLLKTSDRQALKQVSDWHTGSLNALSDEDLAHIASNPDYRGDITGYSVSLYW